MKNTIADIMPSHPAESLTPAAQKLRAELRDQPLVLNALVAAKAVAALAEVSDHLRQLHAVLPHGSGFRGANTARRHQVEALRAELIKSLAAIGVSA